MKFEAALSLMREGKKVKRPALMYPIIFNKEHDLFFSVWDDGYEKTYWIEHSDIIAEDWEVVDE